eukprot:TRINITY_DN3264_c0_g1_i2.p1 TRINITY_DN3264_c0_g1~~TRINITY_DN3264_c0_g1_i2.p1  ORF type:complete len:126 (-),score=15.89 TRINITY_DN3264_c0_g1_i2:29-406(-)
MSSCDCPINSNNQQQRDHFLTCVRRKIAWNDVFDLENGDHKLVIEWLDSEKYQPEDLLSKTEVEIKELESPPFFRGIKDRIIAFKRRCGQRFSEPTQNQPPTNQVYFLSWSRLQGSKDNGWSCIC